MKGAEKEENYVTLTPTSRHPIQLTVFFLRHLDIVDRELAASYAMDGREVGSRGTSSSVASFRLLHDDDEAGCAIPSPCPDTAVCMDVGALEFGMLHRAVRWGGGSGGG